MKPYRLSKYTNIACPHCGKQTRAPGYLMTRAFYLDKFDNKNPKEIADELRISTRYARELLSDMVHLCSECKGRLLPTLDDLRILFLLGSLDMTQKEVARLNDISVYKVRKICQRCKQIYGVDHNIIRAWNWLAWHSGRRHSSL